MVANDASHSKGSPQTARTRLAALRETKPPTKAAQVRALWPDIKAALAKGHTLQSVCDCLQADGITITVQTLGSYITRIRKRPTPSDSSSEAPSREARQSIEGLTTGDAPDRSAVVPNDRSQKTQRDPLANVRERLGKRTGFDYRPELADPKKLI